MEIKIYVCDNCGHREEVTKPIDKTISEGISKDRLTGHEFCLECRKKVYKLEDELQEIFANRMLVLFPDILNGHHMILRDWFK